MKRLISIILLLCYGLVTGGCSGNSADEKQPHSQEQVVSVAKMAEQVKVNAEASLSPDNRILVNGVTNLPNQTELLVSIENDAVGFTAQDNARVSSGSFSAGPLGPISGVTPGNYLVEIIMPIPSTQPNPVQMAIGKDGEYLSGSLVKDSSWGGKTVEYSFNFTVGSKQVIEKAESKHRKLVTEIRSSINKLLNTGKSMEKYRNTENLSSLRTCGNMMRQNQAIAKGVREKAETVPLKYIDLKIAAVEVISCVSCSDDALESCKRVAESLNKK